MLVLDRLTPADLEAALRLSTQAGWNQTAGDWTRLLDLAPDGCIAGRLDGRLVATATLVSYGREAGLRHAGAASAAQAGWIGMVLVDEACRGRGFGSTVLQAALDRGAAVAGEAVGLDATDLGRPVYLKQGFADVAPIDRWSGVLRDAAPPAGIEILDRSNFDDVAALDREAAGADRSELILHLLNERDVFGFAAREDGELAGFAFVRPGRQIAHLGPAVARGPGAFARLLARIARHQEGAPVLVDALRRDAASALLETSGLEIRRRLTRMTHRRPRPLLSGPWIAAATAFEWG